MRTFFLSSLCLLVAVSISPAQMVKERLDRKRAQSYYQPGKLVLGQTKTQPVPHWVAMAQMVPVPVPENPTPQASSTAPVSETQNAPTTSRELTVQTSLQFGYDKQQLLIFTPTPFLADVRRQIRSLVVTAQYPLSDRTNIALSVPYISQSTRVNTPTGTFKQRGSGVGDIGVFLERRFPEIARGTELAVTVGMLMPTGEDPFDLSATQLPTGLGFYQPLARVRLSKMRVPLQFYGALDFGTSLSRDVNGQNRKLPNSYGLETGFYYSISPEFTTQTSLKWSKVSSPYTFETDSNVAYLSQSLTFNTGTDSSLEAGVDVGLTDDALDTFLSLAYTKHF